MPKVSVCIPTYNSASYLAQAIESVLQQEFHDYELVICDNASTDGTPELCRRYDDTRLRYVRFDNLVGQAANWNRCLDLARGEYVVLLHADDIIAPAFLSEAARMLDSNSSVGFVHCTVQHINSDGEVLFVQRLYDENQISSGEVLAKRLLLEGCLVNPSGVMVRRCVYESVGRFTEDIVWGVDWHMWIRVALSTTVAYLAEPLALYRQHSQSGTSGVMATARNGKDETWMLNDIFSRVLPGDSQLRFLRPQVTRQSAHRTWCFGEEMCRLGFMQAARAQIKAAVTIHPVLLFDRRVSTLWMATYLGYDWFNRLHAWKNRIHGQHKAANF